MRTIFAAVRTAIYAALFIGLWGWLALQVRSFDIYLGSFPVALSPIGTVFMIFGGAIVLACLGAFVVRGHGTPAPFDAPREFVAVGPYRYVRNPMYIGAALLLAGSGLYLRSVSIVVFAAVFWGLTHVLVVFYEEPVLREKFDGPYADYCVRVHRWMPHL